MYLIITFDLGATLRNLNHNCFLTLPGKILDSQDTRVNKSSSSASSFMIRYTVMESLSLVAASASLTLVLINSFLSRRSLHLTF